MTIKVKTKICVECGEDKQIFSKGKCVTCASKGYSIKRGKGIKKTYKLKGRDLTSFYTKHIELLGKTLKCQNCGGRINPYLMHNNIAHILPKERYKSVQENDLNVIYLCSGKDGNDQDCHFNFDNKGSVFRQTMNVYSLAVERVKSLQDQVTEGGKLLNEYLN